MLPLKVYYFVLVFASHQKIECNFTFDNLPNDEDNKQLKFAYYSD
jgi:hypothetical protein